LLVGALLSAGVLALAGVLSACGDDEGVRLVPEEPSTGLSPLLPMSADGEAGASAEPGADGAVEASTAEATADEASAADSEPTSCDPAECPEVLLFGALAPGCCRFGNLCGGRVQVSERTSACLAPEVNEQGEALRSALTQASRQPFVSDVACPSHTIDGDELLGCCRAGVCGVDTQPWTRSAAAFGLLLPRACLDPREAAELADEPPGSAPPPRCD
jgi:hypothetical protein